MMTPRERASLAAQLAATPLLPVLHAELARRAIETLLYAKDEPSRIEAQAAVRASRNFRADLSSALSTPRGKHAPV